MVPAIETEPIRVSIGDGPSMLGCVVFAYSNSAVTAYCMHAQLTQPPLQVEEEDFSPAQTQRFAVFHRRQMAELK